MSGGVVRHLQQGSELVDQAIRASRIASVRAEKALHLARTLERRAPEGGHGTRYLAEARRLRAAALVHTRDARGHQEAAEALRV